MLHVSASTGRTKTKVARGIGFRSAKVSLLEPSTAVHAHRSDSCVLTIYQRGRVSLQLRSNSRAQRDVAFAALLRSAAGEDGDARGRSGSDGVADGQQPPPRLTDFTVTVRRASGELGLDLTVAMEYGPFNPVCDAGSRGKIDEMEAIMRGMHGL